MHSLVKGEQMRERMMALLDSISAPDDPPAARLRRSLSIFALHSSGFVLADSGLSEEERRATALEVALDLADATAGCGPPCASGRGQGP